MNIQAPFSGEDTTPKSVARRLPGTLQRKGMSAHMGSMHLGPQSIATLGRGALRDVVK